MNFSVNDSALMAATQGQTLTIVLLIVGAFVLLAVDLILVAGIHKLNKNVKVRAALLAGKDALKDAPFMRCVSSLVCADGGVRDYDLSLYARLVLAEEETQLLFGKLKNALLGYKEVNKETFWEYELYSAGRRGIAALSLIGNEPVICLPAEAAERLDGFPAEETDGCAACHRLTVMLRCSDAVSVNAALSVIAEIAADRNFTRSRRRDADYRENRLSVEELEHLGYIRQV